MLEIRKLPTRRWKDGRRLRLEALKLEPLAFGSTPEEEERLGEREWRKRIRDAWFAMYDEAPVGMIVCSFNHETKFRHIAEIYSFYVSAAHRGKGVGTALLDHALKLIQKNKRIVKVRLYVNGEQRSAVRMYEKVGFAVTGRLDKEMKVGRKFYTMLMMEKMP